jgi:hypothetical protein
VFTQTELDFEMNRAERLSRVPPVPDGWTGWNYWDQGEAVPTGFCLYVPDVGGVFVMGADAQNRPDGDDWIPPGPGPRTVRVDYITEAGTTNGTTFPDRETARQAAEFAAAVIRSEFADLKRRERESR